MTEIQELEAQKINNARLVDFRDQILRLVNNQDFKAVFEQEFFLKEAARLVSIAGDPNLDEKQRNDAMQMALATGHVKRFLSANIQMGNRAEENIHQINEALDEIRAEG